MLRSLLLLSVILLSSAAFADTIRVENELGPGCIPSVENGQAVGANCAEDQPSGGLQNLGLKNGDLIESIDGEQADDPQKAIEVLKRYRTQRRMNLFREGAEGSVDSSDSDSR